MVPLRFLRRFFFVLGVVVLLLAVRAVVIYRSLAEHPEAAHLALLLAASSILIVLILLGAAVVLSRSLGSRLRRMLAGLEGVRKGEYPLLKAEGEDELSQLARGFNHMVDELRQRDLRLQEWSSKEQKAVERAATPPPPPPPMERELLGTVLGGGEGIVVLDAGHRVIMASGRVCELLGVPMEALAGRDLEALLAQLRPRLRDPEKAAAMAAQLRRDPESTPELALPLNSPTGVSLHVYYAPLQGAYAAMLGRIATALDSGRQEEVDRLKSEFLATISHELRTPLTSVKGSLGLVRAGAAGPVSAEMRELLEIAQVNTDRLIQVINDILDVTQLERGHATMHIRPTRLPAAVAGAMQAMAAEASKKRITIESQVSDALPPVRADQQRLTQVLVNLLSNAVKFSPPGSNVQIAARAGDGKVNLSVQDWGRGMSPEFLTRLFRKFEHAQASLTRDSQGVGLGLAICRHIVESHGGSIWAESEPEKGSTFHVSLPAAEDLPAEEAGAGSAQSDAEPEPRLILVIDGDPDVARVISYVFRSQGHRVLMANSGREGMELARRHRPDMVTLDLALPGEDGHHILRSLRAQPETGKIPVICISVQPEAGAALAQGADFFLEKPVDIEKLRALAQRALAVV